LSGFIYFIAAETLGAVKIGFSGSHPTKRLRALQTGCPAPLRLLFYAPGTQAEEVQLHEAFAPLCIHGEWFRNELKLATLLHFLADDGAEEPHGGERVVPRLWFEASVHDALLCAVDFDPVFSSPKTPEYLAEYTNSAVGHPVESFV
jgi:hypothetical protein